MDMAKHATTISNEGFASTSTVREFTIELDPTTETAPDTIESLVATYASCFVPALRVGAEQRSAGELGVIEIDVTGQVNDDGKLESTTFDIDVEAELDAEAANAVVTRALELCKVHDALKPSLHATVTINGHHV